MQRVFFLRRRIFENRDCFFSRRKRRSQRPDLRTRCKITGGACANVGMRRGRQCVRTLASSTSGGKESFGAGRSVGRKRPDPTVRTTTRATKPVVHPLRRDLGTQMNPEALRARVQELRTQFGHVLISAPPMSLFAHAAMVGQLADGVVLIIEANSTRRKATKRLIEQLTAANVRVPGVVLNNRTFPIPEAVYRKL